VALGRPSGLSEIEAESRGWLTKPGSGPNRPYPVISQTFIFRSVSDAVAATSAARGSSEDGSPSSIPTANLLRRELAMIMDVPEDAEFGEDKSPQPLPDARVRWNYVFVWQAPTMMLSYSILGFLIGLIVYVTAPLYNGGD
jgi:hypothetical protein